VDNGRPAVDHPAMGGSPPGDITELLGRMRDGDGAARDALVPLVYRDLEAIATAYARRPGVSLEPRGLVHELYMRLARSPLDARDRKHFFAVAALAMRQILVDRARRRRARKRGGDALRVTLTGVPGAEDGVELIAIEEALRQLEALAPRQARIVELRCLVGLSVAEAAEALGVSERTVHAEWRLARAWLVRALRGEPAGG
jgi:RNA polymerase sigma factor (TIGR02999 family)